MEIVFVFLFSKNTGSATGSAWQQTGSAFALLCHNVAPPLLRCQILRLKCSKFAFPWGSAPDPTEELTEIPGPLTVFKGPTSEEREGNGRGGEKGGEGMVKEREGEDRRWREELGPPKNVGVAIPVLVHDANMVCRQRV